MLDLPFDAQTFIKAGIFPDQKTLIRESLRALWQNQPGVRLDMAIYQYKHEPLSVAKAAALAGISFDQMKDVLSQRGIPVRLGSESAQDALDDLKALEISPE